MSRAPRSAAGILRTAAALLVEYTQSDGSHEGCCALIKEAGATADMWPNDISRAVFWWLFHTRKSYWFGRTDRYYYADSEPATLRRRDRRVLALLFAACVVEDASAEDIKRWMKSYARRG